MADQMIKFLPWRLEECDDDYYVYDSKGNLVATDTSYYPTAPNKEDMIEIIKLVNEQK